MLKVVANEMRLTHKHSLCPIWTFFELVFFLYISLKVFSAKLRSLDPKSRHGCVSQFFVYLGDSCHLVLIPTVSKMSSLPRGVGWFGPPYGNRIRWTIILTKLYIMQVNDVKKERCSYGKMSGLVAFATKHSSYISYQLKQKSIHFVTRFHKRNV